MKTNPKFKDPHSQLANTHMKLKRKSLKKDDKSNLKFNPKKKTKN